MSDAERGGRRNSRTTKRENRERYYSVQHIYATCVIIYTPRDIAAIYSCNNLLGHQGCRLNVYNLHRYCVCVCVCVEDCFAVGSDGTFDIVRALFSSLDSSISFPRCIFSDGCILCCSFYICMHVYDIRME
jgi:hypothetical protein